MKHRYRVILESDEFLADDELNALLHDVDVFNSLATELSNFKVIEAINLEGIKEEIIDKIHASDCDSWVNEPCSCQFKEM